MFIDGNGSEGLDLERRAFIIRKRAEHEVTDVYFPSLSSRTLVYKGMLTSLQLQEFYPDLHDERMDTALALVHSRFSTNTFPSWPLAHPYRFIAHNGEINTVHGQPQLDARARGAAAVATCSPATCRAPSRSARRARPTRRASTRRSSCCTSAGGRCPTPC